MAALVCEFCGVTNVKRRQQTDRIVALARCVVPQTTDHPDPVALVLSRHFAEEFVSIAIKAHVAVKVTGKTLPPGRLHS